MTFSYFGRSLRPFFHLYNCTHANERQIELAVAFDFLHGRSFVNGLEVGNVLGHYGVGGHTVVDHYESASEYQTLKGWRVHNVDVFDIATKVGSRFDWIVAISTLEHVGFDWQGETSDLEAAPRAIAYLRGLLAAGGTMLVTMPCGFHPMLDQLIVEDLTGAARSCTFVRDGAEAWVQTDEPTIIPYGSQSQWAASVFIGEFGPLTSWPEPPSSQAYPSLEPSPARGLESAPEASLPG